MVSLVNRIACKTGRLLGSVSRAAARARLKAIGRIRLAPNAKVDWSAVIDISPARGDGWIVEIGAESHVKAHARLGSRGGFIQIGRNCTINPFCVLLGYGGIAAHSSIIAFNHVFGGADTPIAEQVDVYKGVTIEDDVWISTGGAHL